MQLTKNAERRFIRKNRKRELGNPIGIKVTISCFWFKGYFHGIWKKWTWNKNSSNVGVAATAKCWKIRIREKSKERNRIGKKHITKINQRFKTGCLTKIGNTQTNWTIKPCSLKRIWKRKGIILAKNCLPRKKFRRNV